MNTKLNWILFIASRYLFKGRGNSPILAILGITTGVLALIVIISVMNGFQLGFIENILEISSYHLRAESSNLDLEKQDVIDYIQSVNGVKAVVPFSEFQAIARGRRSGQNTVLVRGLMENTLDVDFDMARKFEFEDGYFDLRNEGSILLGSELARRIGVVVGEEISIYSIAGLLSVTDEDSMLNNYTVKGIFRTGYYEYDSTWAIINLNDNLFKLNDSKIIAGIKINNRFNDRIVMERLEKSFRTNLDFTDISFTSWRDYNRSFFSALRTEKLFMFILVGLIFIVVGLNIFQGQRRAVLQRKEEIGLLRAVGGTMNSVRFVFVFDGAIIGFSGAGIGAILGILIASNIQGFFTLIENIVNSVIGFINFIINLIGAEIFIGNFALFSPAVFYLKEIPSRILPMEVIVIFLFGFLSALCAAWFASGKIIKIQPAEVLRYE